MKRSTIVIFAGLAMAVGSAVFGGEVVAPDGSAISDVLTAPAGGGTTWVRVGLGAPIAVTPNADGKLHLSDLVSAEYLVQDAVSGKPIEEGSLRWQVPGAPDELVSAPWHRTDGHLDLPCRGGERVVISAPGYAPTPTRVVVDGRRHTVLLQPRGAVTIELEPAIEAQMWLAREDQIDVLTLFTNVAAKYEIAEDGTIDVHDLDLEAGYVGVVVAQGMAPAVTTFRDFSEPISVNLVNGIGVSGLVLDEEGEPLGGAKIDILGEIAELDSFRYSQRGTSDPDGGFTLDGLLPGTVRIRACADGRACAEAAVELSEGQAIDLVTLELIPGRDALLVVENEIGERVANAILYFNDRVYETDAQGQLRVPGLTRRTTIPVKIFGSGFGVWEGSFSTDQERVVITVPGGGIIEQKILSARRFSPDEVIVRWQAYTASGREGKSGMGSWDAEQAIARASGLETGTYSLSVRLPGSATSVSERVEVTLGEEVMLAPVVPDRGLAVSGRVLDAETLQPIPGARVKCEPGSPAVFRAPELLGDVPSTLTDTDGMFLLEGLDPGTCRTIITASGYAAWRLDGIKPDDIGYDIGDAEMDAGMTIVGQVYDRLDRPITGAVVEITEAAAYAYFAETKVRTDHDGYFRADRVPVGVWKVTASHGQETASDTVEGDARETVVADLMLGGIRIEGEIWLGDDRAPGGTLVLTTEGAQAPGVVVMMQRVTDDRQIFGIDQQPMQFVVSPDGRFGGSGLVAGSYYASYTPPGSGSAPITKSLIVPQVDTYQCAIQYSDAAVEGYVVDDDHNPVAGASVLASAGDGIQDLTAYTDTEGRFFVRGLEPGHLVLTASHTDFAPSSPSELEIRDGSAEGPIVLELLPHDGASILLAVNTLAGSAGGAPVYLVGPETSTGFTDGGGLATFSGIPAGSYRPCGIAYGGATGCGPNLSVDNGDQLQAQLDLGQGGYVDIYLEDDANGIRVKKGVMVAASTRGPSIRVMTADGVDLSSLLFMASPPQETNAGVRIGPLQADDYVVSVNTAVGPRQGQVRVREGEGVSLDLR
jgi:protocatechuate 3,4-dioxygenase beta subunit